MIIFSPKPVRKTEVAIAIAGMIWALAAVAAEPITMAEFLHSLEKSPAAKAELHLPTEMLPDEAANSVSESPVQMSPSKQAMSDGKEEKQEPASFEKNSSQDENIAATPKQAASKGFIELGGARHLLTGQQPSWASNYVRGSWIQSDKNVWNYEVVNASRFGDNGIFLSGGLTRNFSDAWYGSLALGTSEGGFFWPRYRVDAFLHHKLLEKKNLVATVGLTIFQAKDIHHDRILHLGADYYFENPWIVSGEFVVNNSSPGNVNANYAFLAATYGRDKNQYLTLRLGSGKEAYQLLGNSQVISGFYSRIATVTYRKWVGREWGFNVVGEEYTNPLYGRRGIQFGIFKDL